MHSMLSIDLIDIIASKVEKEEECDTKLTHVCRHLHNMERLGWKYREKAGAFSQHCGFQQLLEAVEVIAEVYKPKQ